MARINAQLLCLSYLASGLMLQGCSSTPSTESRSAPSPPVVEASIGDEIAMRALSLLGAPYKWGGAGPVAFDCSGLVRFVHDQIGINVPRTAAEQFSAARPVQMSGLEPGDLLFFRIKGSRISHVAIYTGEGRFIHAPQAGRPVELRMLDDDFYRPRLAGAGRLF
jgi:murein DD-endopeptidase